MYCYTKIAPGLHVGRTVVNTLRALRLSREPTLNMKLGTWQVLKPSAPVERKFCSLILGIFLLWNIPVR